MQKEPPMVDIKVEMLLELSMEEGATLEPTFSMRDDFHIDIGRYVCWNKSNPMLVGQIQNMAGQPEKRWYATMII